MNDTRKSVSLGDLRAACQSRYNGKAGHDVTLSSFGVLTHNRPEALRRCLISFLNNFVEYRRKPRIVVADDSDTRSAQAENVAILQELGRTYSDFTFCYAGMQEKRHYAQILSDSSGVDPAIIEFALFDPENRGRTIGANRNTLFLQTAGECFLSIDDDVICRPAKRPVGTTGLNVTSRSDPTRLSFYPDRETLLNENGAAAINVLGQHESLLGKNLGDVFSIYPDNSITCKNLDDSLLARLKEKASTIRISWTGIYGDCGAANPGYYLWKDNHTRAQLTASADIYGRLSISREIFRAPSRVTIGPGDYCQTTAIAFDHRDILPPFMPVMRAEDILFGKTLALCSDLSLIAYQPWALLHAPIEARTASAADIASSGRVTSLAMIIASLMDVSRDPSYSGSNADSLRRLGEALCAFGQMSKQQFEEVLYHLLSKKTVKRIEFLRKHQENCIDPPSAWCADIRSHIENLTARLGGEGLGQSILARDSDAPIAQRMALIQRLTVRYGGLLQAWPFLVEASLDLKSRGITLGRSVNSPILNC